MLRAATHGLSAHLLNLVRRILKAKMRLIKKVQRFYWSLVKRSKRLIDARTHGVQRLKQLPILYLLPKWNQLTSLLKNVPQRPPLQISV